MGQGTEPFKPVIEYEGITLRSKLDSGYWAVITLIILAALPHPPSQASPVSTDLIVIEELAQLALDCVHQEYPNHVSHTLQSDADVRPPRELTPSTAPEAKRWRDNIRPLEAALVARLTSWLPNLTYPVRSGTHSQTAFALGLTLDWARSTDDKAVEAFLIERIETLYQTDIDCPLGYEPSGADFLSPCLAEADLMRRVLGPSAFATWLDNFLTIPADAEWLAPALVSDRSDPHLVHLDGLNLSRAWMLEGIASGLPETDDRVSVIQKTALLHRLAGLDGVNSDYYEGGHWLGSFATYLVTQRGLAE